MRKGAWSTFGGIALASSVACSLVLPIHEAPQGAPTGMDASGTDAGGDVGSASDPRLLFRSGFEGNVTLEEPSGCSGNNCSQLIAGGAPPTESWPPSFWGGTGAFQLLANTGTVVDASSIDNHMTNELVTAAGREGAMSRMLFQRFIDGTTHSFHYVSDAAPPASLATQGDLYVASYVKFAEDVRTHLEEGGARELFHLVLYPTRYVLELRNDVSFEPAWVFYKFKPGTADPEWTATSDQQIPATQWFKLEVFFHGSAGPDGRVWIAVDGTPIVDRRGANIDGPKPITDLYFCNAKSTKPSEQWCDDIEIWDGFPASAAPH